MKIITLIVIWLSVFIGIKIMSESNRSLLRWYVPYAVIIGLLVTLLAFF